MTQRATHRQSSATSIIGFTLGCALPAIVVLAALGAKRSFYLPDGQLRAPVGDEEAVSVAE
jgi:hypothetical protein